MQRVGIGWVVVLLLSGPHVGAETGTVTIHATQDGSPVTGMATLTDTSAGLQVVVEVSNVTPGAHGLHIHQFGSCGDGGNAAGGHYNPDGVKHGFLPKDGFSGAHAGDLGNIEIGANGSGTLELTLPPLRLSGAPYSVGGRAIVLHEKGDDFGQPTGNAGGRIGCGVIAITGQ